MTRLNFVLPEWTRTAWTSAAARAVWEPRIQAAARAWEAIEREAVAMGAKPSCLQNVPPDRLPEVAAAAAARGLVALPMGTVASGATYSASSRPAAAGEAWSYRVVTTTAALAADWGEAWRKGDDVTIGRLLGFPRCCQAFFQKWWTEDRWLDLTWPAAGSLMPETNVQGPPEANILGRWVGVRLVSHMPCSFVCAESAAIGRRMAEVGEATGYRDEVATIREVLSWPMEWSALHGIAEVKTPVYRVSTRTDATAEKLVVRYRGAGWPAEGATGVSFPYQRPAGVIPLTSLRAYRKAFDTTEWTDNGFQSREAMDSAHRTVLACFPEEHTVVQALDLGCGNGALLLKVPRVIRCGVEIDPDRFARAEMRLDHAVNGDIADVRAWVDYARESDVIVLMPGRLLEMAPDRADAVRTALRGKHVVAYAYGDWLSRYGSVHNVAHSAGLHGRVVKEAAGADVAAALIEVA